MIYLEHFLTCDLFSEKITQKQFVRAGNVGHKLIVTFREGEELLRLDENYVLVLAYERPDGETSDCEMAVTDDGRAETQIPQWALAVVGDVRCSIRLYREGSSTVWATSPVFTVVVCDSIEATSAETAQTALDQILAGEADRKAAELARVQAELLRVQAELDRVAAEAQREQTLPLKADKDSTVLTGSLSMGRKDGTAVGNLSTALGYSVEAPGRCAVAVGGATKAGGNFSLAEGYTTEATGEASHAEGYGAKATASSSHAEGRSTTAASNYQHAQGKYNVPDSSGVYAHIVGNGTDADHRSNCHTLDWQGNAWFAGNIRVGGNGFGTGRSITAAPVYVPAQISGTVNYTLAQDGATDTFTLKYFYESGTVVLESLRGMVGETGTNIRTATCVRGGAPGRYLIWHSAGVDLLPQAYVMEQVWTPSEQDVFIGLIDTITGKILFGNGNFVRAADETALLALHG